MANTQYGIRRNEDGSASFDGQSMLASLGGWIGIAESIVPSTAFLIVFITTKSIWLSVAVAGTLGLASLVRQLVAKRPISQAIAGIVGIALSSYLALRPEGQGADYYVPGLWTNAAYLAVITISVLVRWPIVGVIVSLLLGKGFGWRLNKSESARYYAASFVWIALFGARLVVKLPLYLSGNLEALGIAHILMSIPLYALALWFNWLLIRRIVVKPA